MRRLGIVAIGLVVTLAAVGVAVWASVGDAPWERTAITISATPPPPSSTKVMGTVLTMVAGITQPPTPTACEEARKVYNEAEQFLEGLQTSATAMLQKGQGFDADKAAAYALAFQRARDERLRALEVMSEACR